MDKNIKTEKISLFKMTKAKYPKKEFLFRPSVNYPEYQLKDVSGEANLVYEGVRENFRLLKMDIENYGKKSWNPLGSIIKPGDKVLLKPNLVKHQNKNTIDCLYTHPSVVAAVIDYVIIALKGKGTIIVGDAPIQECDFEQLITESGYDKLIEYYQNQKINIELKDFRGLIKKENNTSIETTIDDKKTGKIIDLGIDSEFAEETHNDKLRITNYDPTILNDHHNEEVHEYYVAEDVLSADVIINIPKPKTHKKAGVTIALKNLVGINVRKEFLPHHTIGSKKQGGDEYHKKNLVKKINTYLLDKRNISYANKKKLIFKIYCILIKICNVLLRLFPDKTKEGSWFGNNTINKTIVDLNKIILYADKKGIMKNKVQRKLFIVADMVISGEKEGPLAPVAKKVGLIAMGQNSVCFDETITTIMGIDKNKIPTLINARNSKKKYVLVTENVKPKIVSNFTRYNNKLISDLNIKYLYNFEPSAGWKGHIEMKNRR